MRKRYLTFEKDRVDIFYNNKAYNNFVSSSSRLYCFHLFIVFKTLIKYHDSHV